MRSRKAARKPFVVVDDLFDAATLSVAQCYVDGVRRRGIGTYAPMFERLEIPWDEFFADLHYSILDRACDLIGVDLQISYNCLAMYGFQGICPAHTDRPACQFTISWCISQAKPWSLIIEGRECRLRSGEAVVYEGRRQTHSRPRIQPDNFCNIVFFHFVDANYDETLLAREGPPLPLETRTVLRALARNVVLNKVRRPGGA